jgi:peptidoglycan hydrolase-like protein with peptidoglycan-binding domain
MNARGWSASDHLMKKLLLFLALALPLQIPTFADDRLRDVQAELKAQGFYYGEVHGNSTPETTAAIRRFQIRNGLEVTGTLTDETSKALSGGTAPEVPAPAAPAPPAAAPRPPVDLRREQPIEESDKKFLRREETHQPAPAPQAPVEDDPSAAPVPRAPDAPSPDLPLLFADTPYATAPLEVQEATLRRAQKLLASRGVYRDVIDGAPGPATEEAILSFQRASRLPLTGRLDLETLSLMRLLPGRSQVPLKSFNGPRETSNPPVLRGIWIR